MNAQDVFGDYPLAKFIDGFLHRLPFALKGAAGSACPLGDWPTLEAALSGGSADVLVARDGERCAAQPPGDLAAARRLIAEGCTIVVRHAERYHGELDALAGSFAATFGGPVDVQMFVTPPGRSGFGWHYDAEDVFIMQIAGDKTYSLRKNTVNPWPLAETLPVDMQYEREIMPLMQVTLRGADLLYIPCGYWHRTCAGGSEVAVSLALGVMSRTAIDVFDALRPRLAESLPWRQRLPVLAGEGAVAKEQLAARYAQLFDDLANDIAHELRSPAFMEQWLAHCKRPSADG
ncbi:MAG: hypothetical protein DCC67_14055 [Planctomycetota bacterium]|nr:MAG: hypothetical protein DCC67_14055 [Planctomycetota bacterium]